MPTRSPCLLWLFAASALSACGSDWTSSAQLQRPVELASKTHAATADIEVTVRPVASRELCLTAQNDQDADGTAVVLEPCDGKKSQLWHREGNALVVFDKQCLNVKDGSATKEANAPLAGTLLQTWTCADEDVNNHWSGTAQLMVWGGDATQCLDVKDGVFAANTPLQIYTCSPEGTNDHQLFGWSFQQKTLDANTSHPASNANAAAANKAPAASTPAASSPNNKAAPAAPSTAASKPATASSPNAKTTTSASSPNTKTTTTASSPNAKTQPAASKPATASSPNTKTASTATGSTAAASAPKATTTTSSARLRMGIHIDYDNGSTNGVAGFESRTGVTPALTAGYVNCNADGSFQLSTAKTYIDQAANGKAKAVSLAVTSYQSGNLTSSQVSGIQSAVSYGVGKGLSVEIRFGYEMNGNWSPSYHSNDPTTFKNQWAQVASVVHKAGGKMVWCPNNNGGKTSDYERWLPADASSIDGFALDSYHRSMSAVATSEIDNAIALLYPLCKQYNKPFYFGETSVYVNDGAFTTAPSAAGIALKKAWLNALVDASILSKYPLYAGFTWFDYNKTESITGLAGGTVTNNRFTISQDTQDAAMFSAWKKANTEVQ